MNAQSLLNKRYQLQKRLGTGGMAVVYEGRDLMLERTVAVKVLRENFSSDPAFRERFRQEAKAAANLTHSNIVTVHDFGLDAGRLFIVMEYVPGSDLKTILKQRGRFSVEETINLLVQACAGIGYAHRAGLVHCDIKPHNLLVSPDQRLKVADFGIARALASINPKESSEVVWGSPQYLSPEQAAGGAPSPASDVYGLGVVMYELLTGKLPFEAQTAAEMARLHREAEPVPPSRLNPAIPPVLEQVILKILSKEPSARYRTADQLGRVLLTFARSQEAERTAGTPEAPSPEVSAPPPLARPAAAPRASLPPTGDSRAAQAPAEPAFDWVTAALGLLAFVMVGGLIPFWIWVYLSFFPPPP